MKNLLATPLVTTLAATLALAACGGSKSDSPAAAPALDLAAVNALVPADLKATLVFDKTDVIEQRGKRARTYTLAAPKGWTQSSKMFAKLRPTEGNLGFMTSFDVGSNCDGTCEPKDWAKVADKVDFAQLADGTILKDEAGKTSRLMIVEKGDRTFVVFASWTAGASRYNTCSATLEAPVKDAAAAFAKACEAVSSSGDA